MSHKKQNVFLTYYFFLQLLSTLTLVHTRIPTKVSYKKQNVFLTYFFLQLLSNLTLVYTRTPTKVSYKKTIYYFHFFLLFLSTLTLVHTYIPTEVSYKKQFFPLFIFSSAFFNLYSRLKEIGRNECFTNASVFSLVTFDNICKQTKKFSSKAFLVPMLSAIKVTQNLAKSWITTPG